MIRRFLRQFTTTIQVKNGGVVLPLKNDRVLFSLSPDDSVGDLTVAVKDVDPTISFLVRTEDGARVAPSTLLSTVLKNGALFEVDETSFPVSVEERQPGFSVGGVASDAMIEKILALKDQLKPLEARKAEIDALAERRAQRVVWYGAAGLLGQWCFLARLTWWDLNWDVMEPVTYFITTGTGLIMYVYFAVSRTEFSYDSWLDRLKKRRQIKLYEKKGFDIVHFEKLNDLLDSMEKSISPSVVFRLREREWIEAHGKDV